LPARSFAVDLPGPADPSRCTTMDALADMAAAALRAEQDFR
jgi:hypothetical protein